jgi:hypothetical protein
VDDADASELEGNAAVGSKLQIAVFHTSQWWMEDEKLKLCEAENYGFEQEEVFRFT